MLGSCILAAPQMSITFASVVALNGGSFEDMKKKIKQDIPATWIAGNVFWVPINYIQYRFTPLYYRATLGGICGGKQPFGDLHLAFWNIYLAKQSAKPVNDNKLQ